MRGETIRVLSVTQFDASGLTAAGASQKIVVAQRIPSAWYKDGVLEARVHANTSDKLAVAIDVFPDGFTDEDPATEFLAANSIGTVSFADTDTAGTFSIKVLTSGSVTSMLAVQLTLTANGGAATGKITLSADLNLMD